MNAAVSTRKDLTSWIAYLRSHAAIKRQLAVGGSGSLADALAAEAAAQQRCGATADHAEATRAFVAKRRPTFTGR